MQNDYSWNGGSRGASSYQLPKNEGLGRWVVVALVLAVILHIAAFFWLSSIDILIPKTDKESDLLTQVVHVKPVDFQDHQPEISAPEPEVAEAEPVDVVPPADELEMLEKLPDIDMDISPEIETVQVPDIEAVVAGELNRELMEPMTTPNFDPELPDMGKTEDFFPRANDSQVSIDPGSRMGEEYDPDKFTEAMRKGAEGDAEDGLLKEFATLDQMAHMDGNTLQTSKALIGSDLLFEFGSADLRESARVSLMKVAMLIFKHPDLVCWVEGHTDLIGGEASNMELSIRRAMSVKRWLVNAMEIDEKRIAVRGFGEQHPIVKSGTREQQAVNRRVEIKMRKYHPKDEVDYRSQPAKGTLKSMERPVVKSDTASKPEKPPVRAILVKPNRELPPEGALPKAILVQEDEPAPKAIVEPEEPQNERVHKAVIVEEDKPVLIKPARAIPVEE